MEHHLMDQYNLWLVLFSVSIALITWYSAYELLFRGIDTNAFFIDEKWVTQSEKLKRNEQYYQSLFDLNPDIVITFDLHGDFLSVNKVIEAYGYTVEELLHQSFVPLIVPDQLDKTLENFRIASKGAATHYETAFIAKNGDRIEIQVTNIPIQVDCEIVGVYAVVKDITDLKQAQNALVEAESKYRFLVEESLVGIYIIQEERFVYVNPQLIQMTGYKYEELIGAEVSSYIYPEDAPLVEENVENRLMNGSSGIRYQYRAVKKDQSIMCCEVIGSKTVFNGKPAVIGSVIDRTEQKKAEELIQHMAYHDILTGLPNRYQLLDQFGWAISNRNIEKATILFMNLDRFKMINDTLGHELGDLLLKEISTRLKGGIEPEVFLARYGGDEFIFFLPNTDQVEAVRTANHILDRIKEPFHINEYELYITPSIGISRYPHDGKDIGTLIKKADLALNQAKRLGKNNYQFYRNQSMEVTNERFEMEIDLHKALEREEFLLYFQPKLNIHSGEIVGVEVLIRWDHPDKGMISPQHFIPLAEETGLILPIGEWVLRKACAQQQELRKMGLPPIAISVNLSIRQFFQPGLIRMIRQILHDTALPPEYLELEITESMMIDSHHSLMVVKELKKLGVRVSLDDFGTGYSSLHYLKELPIDKLKIDQSFIRDCLTDTNDATIVKTIISMAHQLKIEVTAEGVETKEQLIFLQQNFCNEAQGYLFSKPLPLQELQDKYYEIEQFANQIGVPKKVRDQKWMEESLRVIQQELLDTVRQQHGMTFKFKKQDDRFIHTLCDGEMLYRMGIIPEQIMGRDLYEIHSAEIAKDIAACYQRAWNGEQDVIIEGERNGIHYIAYLRPIRRGGQVVEVIGSCVDITERKQMEERLRYSEAKYRLITENMSDLIRIVDIHGMIQYVSPSNETVLGYPPDQIKGFSIFQFVHPDDISHAQKAFIEMVSSKIPFRKQFRQKHSLGHWLHVEVLWNPVLGKTGEVKHIVAVLRDITERKQAEEFLRKSDRLSVVAELAAGVAHEIRNPLTSIKGFVQLFKIGMNKPEYFDIMLAEFQQLEDIIHEFLMIANPKIVQCKQTNLLELLERIMRLLEPQAHLDNIQLNKEFETNLPLIWCDENQLKQVFINLLKNAMESMSEGGEIVFQVKRRDPDQVSIRVIDQGCGIPGERVKRLGEPFYSTKEKGTGLGLMVCFRIIEEHQGMIHFESEVGRGTTVEVVLPVNDEEI